MDRLKEGMKVSGNQSGPTVEASGALRGNSAPKIAAHVLFRDAID